MSGFKHGSLTTEVSALLAQLAVQIRASKQSIGKNIILIGANLIEAKKALGHGRFSQWLAAEFGWTDRTARNYMRAAAMFEGKSETVSVLPPKVIYQLAAPAIPTAVREQAIRHLENGGAPADVIKLIDKARAGSRLRVADRVHRRRTAYLERAEQARRFASYSGPVTKETIALARQVATAWENLAKQMEMKDAAALVPLDDDLSIPPFLQRTAVESTP